MKNIKKTTLLLLIVAIVFIISSCSDDNNPVVNFPPDYNEISHQALLDEVNFARSYPAEYAKLIEDILPYYGGKDDKLLSLPNQTPILTSEGKTLAIDAINFLKKQVVRQKLRLDLGLNKSAQYHCNLQGPTGQVGHDSPNGENVEDRIEKFGTLSSNYSFGENIAYGPDLPRQIVMQLIIDDGVPDRGHRTLLFASKFDAVGFGWGSHSVYEIMCVMDFAFGYTAKP